MKKRVIILMLLNSLFILSASTPEMPAFPSRYENWNNYQRFNKEKISINFDFINYETSFHESVTGFNEKFWGSSYGGKISERIVTQRDLMQDSVAIYFSYLKGDRYIKKNKRKEALKTAVLLYDDKKVSLSDYIVLETYGGARIIDPYCYFDALGYLPKDIFIEISNSNKCILTFEVDGETFEVPLQIPYVYEDTFDFIKK